MAGYRRVNYNELCRLCTSVENTGINIFSEEGERRQLATKIQTCFPVLNKTCDDSLPKVVCTQCVEKLDSYFSFRQNCIHAESTLLGYFTSQYSNSGGTCYVKDGSFVKMGQSNENYIPNDNSRTNYNKIVPTPVVPTLTPPVYQPQAIPADPYCQPVPVMNEVPTLPEQVYLYEPGVTDCPNTDGQSLVPCIVEPTVNLMPVDAVAHFNQPYGDDGSNQQMEMTLDKNGNSPSVFGTPEYQDQPMGMQIIDSAELTELKQMTPISLGSDGHLIIDISEDTDNTSYADAIDEKMHDVSVMSDTHKGENVTDIYKCTQCQKEFYTIDELNQHQCTPKNQDPTEDAGENSENLVYEHYKFCDPGGPFGCDICHRLFLRKNHLTQHKLLHSGQRPFVCQICDTTFSRHDRLLRHLRTHDGERNFICGICDRAFARKDNLITHMKNHENKEEGPFTCPKCDKTFVMKHYFLLHIKAHDAEPRRPHACSTCGALFPYKRNLCAHQQKYKHYPPTPAVKFINKALPRWGRRNRRIPKALLMQMQMQMSNSVPGSINVTSNPVFNTVPSSTITSNSVPNTVTGPNTSASNPVHDTLTVSMNVLSNNAPNMLTGTTTGTSNAGN